jgi:hypothetical protein
MQVEIIAPEVPDQRVPRQNEAIMATPEDLVRINAQGHEILKRVGNGSLDPVLVRQALQRIIVGDFEPLPAEVLPVLRLGYPIAVLEMVVDLAKAEAEEIVIDADDPHAEEKQEAKRIRLEFAASMEERVHDFKQRVLSS